MQKELEMFEKFINDYDLTIPQLKGKKEHTYRVVGYAKEIAKSLLLSNEDINLAGICALFHDLGRFPQYTQYHTFYDDDSIDHGDKSYEILKELNYNNEIVLKAVKYHNKYRVDDSLNERELLFANITRDADKIDIMLKQLGDSYKEDYNISNDIMNFFYEQKLINNETIKNKTDGKLRTLTFIFDINYKKSFEIIKESNIIDKYINLIYNATNDEKIFEIRDILNERIDNYVR